jgi:aldose 1-epimerase
MSLEVLTYGGIVTRLLVPDRNGRLGDVVLGFDSLEPYLQRHPYFGAITGRVAGRIAGSRISIGDETFVLSANEGRNHLHGGFNGLDRRVWKATLVHREDGGPSLRLTYRSPDGEEGYPGNVDLAVTYSLTPDNVFVIETEAQSDRPTPISLTHHSYFNLAGEGSGPVTDHELQIPAGEIFPTDKAMLLRRKTVPVFGEGGDFTCPLRIGDVLPHLYQLHGDLYRLRDRALTDGPSPAARLFSPASGRVLTVSTTETCLQVYSGASLDGSLRGKTGARYEKHAGLCLECEGFPEAVRYPEVDDILVTPERPQRRETRYAFSVAETFPLLSS